MSNRWAAAHNSTKHILNSGFAVKVVVGSGSMTPSLSMGQVVRVLPVKDNPIYVGDIVLRSQESKDALFVHRCLGKFRFRKKTFFITKGDNVLYTDLIIDESFILGKVTAQESGFRKLYYRYIQILLLPYFILHMVIIRKKAGKEHILIST